MTGYMHTSNYGGWAANLFPFDPFIHVNQQNGFRMAYPGELPQPPSLQFYDLLAGLTSRPFFDDSQHPLLYDEVIGDGSAGSNYARENRDTIISEMIPCTTFAAGRNPLTLLEDDELIVNIDMNSSMMTDPNRWPLSEAHDPEMNIQRPWLHSDIREKAYSHNWKVFDEFVGFGELKE